MAVFLNILHILTQLKKHTHLSKGSTIIVLLTDEEIETSIG